MFHNILLIVMSPELIMIPIALVILMCAWTYAILGIKGTIVMVLGVFIMILVKIRRERRHQQWLKRLKRKKRAR